MANLFAVLRTQPEFRTVYKTLQDTKVKIVPSSEVSLRPTGSRDRPAGSYNPISGIIELPSRIYANSRRIRSSEALELIAHEVYHAWQFRKVYKLSGGGNDEARGKIIAQAVQKAGRDKFIESSLRMEKAAEEFAVRVVLKTLKKEHSGLRLYRSEIGPITASGFYSWKLKGWWDANESLYRESAEIEWVQWMYRISEGDYKAEFDKAALKRWLQANPDIR